MLKIYLPLKLRDISNATDLTPLGPEIEPSVVSLAAIFVNTVVEPYIPRETATIDLSCVASECLVVFRWVTSNTYPKQNVFSMHSSCGRFLLLSSAKDYKPVVRLT